MEVGQALQARLRTFIDMDHGNVHRLIIKENVRPE